MPSKLETQAKAIAARVDAKAVGFDPITIITIITTVLPLLLKCFNKTPAGDAPTDSITSRLKAANEQNRSALLRRTARRIRGEAEEPMSKNASLELARAVVDQALSVPDTTAIACCSEAGV